MTMMGFRCFPEMKANKYWSKMKQNNSTELLGFSFHNIYSKVAPPDPKSGFFFDFLGFSQALAFESFRTFQVEVLKMKEKCQARIDANEELSSC